MNRWNKIAESHAGSELRRGPSGEVVGSASERGGREFFANAGELRLCRPSEREGDGTQGTGSRHFGPSPPTPVRGRKGELGATVKRSSQLACSFLAGLFRYSCSKTIHISTPARRLSAGKLGGTTSRGEHSAVAAIWIAGWSSQWHSTRDYQIPYRTGRRVGSVSWLTAQRASLGLFQRALGPFTGQPSFSKARSQLG